MDHNEKNTANKFILPMVSAKVAAVGGLYVGGGVSGKYLIATESDSPGYEAKKKIRLMGKWYNRLSCTYRRRNISWILKEDLAGTLTNKQFSEYKNDPETYGVKNGYDIAFYAGVGFRAVGSNY